MTLYPLCDAALEDVALDTGLVAEPASRCRGYRVPSARLPGFDYGSGMFFVTAVTRDRVPWFGALEDGRIVSFDLESALRSQARLVADLQG